MLAFLDDERPADARGLRAYETILLLVLVAESWARAVPKWGQLAPAYHGHLAAVTVLVALGLHLPWRRAAFGALAALYVVLVWREFPASGNHAYLEIVLCALGALFSVDDPEERRLYVRVVRWIVVLIVFYSGVQKAVHGYWARGQYLAFSLGAAGFGALHPLVPDSGELARLTSYRGQPGDGPYLTASWPLLAVSNLTVLLELALAPLLVWRRTRTLAAVAGLILLACIEVGAREVFFGFVFANAIVLYLPATVHRLLVVPAALALCALVLSRFGFLPAMTFY